MIEIKDLSFSYAKEKVLNHIDLTIDKGELFGLLGANGAGKTTLISILNGLQKEYEGAVFVDGMKLKTSLKKIQTISSLVPQSLAFYPNLTAYENLEFFGSLYGLSGIKLKEKIGYALEITSLKKVVNQKAVNYSGGLKRRLNIAIGLLNEPRILYLDEPTVGIDPQSRNYILQMIKKINQEKKMTVIYTSHYMEEVEFLCDRVCIIDKGKVLKNLKKSEFSKANQLEHIFLQLTDTKLRD